MCLRGCAACGAPGRVVVRPARGRRPVSAGACRDGSLALVRWPAPAQAIVWGGCCLVLRRAAKLRRCWCRSPCGSFLAHWLLVMPAEVEPGEDQRGLDLAEAAPSRPPIRRSWPGRRGPSRHSTGQSALTGPWFGTIPSARSSPAQPRPAPTAPAASAASSPSVPPASTAGLGHPASLPSSQLRALHCTWGAAARGRLVPRRRPSPPARARAEGPVIQPMTQRGVRRASAVPALRTSGMPARKTSGTAPRPETAGA